MQKATVFPTFTVLTDEQGDETVTCDEGTKRGEEGKQD